MPITDFSPGNFEADAGLQRPEDLNRFLDGLAAVNRRVWIVGNFNARPGSSRLFHFGSLERRKVIAGNPALTGVVRCVATASGTAFYDEVKPLVVEKLKPAANDTVIQAGTPAGEGDEDATMHEVNSFLLLYSGYDPRSAEQIAADAVSKQAFDESRLGRALLERLEKDLDSYLDLMTDLPSLVTAFNDFLPTRQSSLSGQLLPGGGVDFHDNFNEQFFEFLLREDRGLPFDPKALLWETFEKRLDTKFEDADRKKFALDVKAFKTALLDDQQGNAAVDADLRRRFQQHRQRVLQAGKTVHTKLILSLLPLWVFRELLRKPPGQGFDLKKDAEPVFQKIMGRDKATRMVRLEGSEADIPLAEPVRRLNSENRVKLRTLMEEQITAVIDAWAFDKAAEQEKVLANLKLAGLTDDEMTRIKSGLAIVGQICAQRAAQAEARGGDPVVARKAATGMLQRAWLGALRGQYLNVLVGEPVTFIDDVKDALVSDLQQLYIMAELSRDEVGKQLLDAARAGISFLSQQSDNKGGLKGGLDASLPKLQAGFLKPAAGVMNEKLLTNLCALEAYARLRAERLAAGTGQVAPDQAGVKHSKISSGDKNLGRAAGTVTPAQIREAADREALSAEKAQSTPVQPVIAEVAVEADGGQAKKAVGEGVVSPTGSAPAANPPPAPSGSGGGTSPEEKPSPPATASAAVAKPDAATDPAKGAANANPQRATLKDLLKSFAPAPTPAPPVGTGGAGEPSSSEPADDGSTALVASAEESLKLIWQTRQRTKDEGYKSLCRRVAMAELLLMKHDELRNFGKDKSFLYQLTLDLLAYGPKNLSDFFKDHSLTEYFDLKSSKDLHDRYRRLQLQTREAARAMARYISEVRSVAELIDSVSTRLVRDTELFLFNGTTKDLLAWLEESRRGGGQFWDPDNIADSRFIRPGLVYVLESALVAPDPVNDPGTGENEEPDTERSTAGKALRAFVTALGQFDPSEKPGRYLPLPPILFSTTLTADEAWHGPLDEASTPDWPALPCPFYFVGPARAVTARGPLGQITKPAGFFVVESLLTGQTLAEPIADKADLATVVRPAQVVSLSRTKVTIDAAVRELIQEGRVDRDGRGGAVGVLPPLEAVLWLAQVELLKIYLRTNGPAPKALAGKGQADFWKCFVWLDKISPASFEDRQKWRKGLKRCLTITGLPAGTTLFRQDDAPFSIRRQQGGNAAQLAVLKNVPEQPPAVNEEQYYPAAWFTH